jgi:hypothetical protein
MLIQPVLFGFDTTGTNHFAALKSVELLGKPVSTYITAFEHTSPSSSSSDGNPSSCRVLLPDTFIGQRKFEGIWIWSDEEAFQLWAGQSAISKAALTPVVLSASAGSNEQK